MSNLWERMGYMYGHKFTSVHGETAYVNGELTEAAKTWATGLRGLAGEQVANGLHACIDSGEAWPPTLPEFVEMCKGKAVDEFGLGYVPEYHRKPETNPERILSSGARDQHRKEVSKKAVADLRAALGKK